jgi:hypothetical protein
LEEDASPALIADSTLSHEKSTLSHVPAMISYAWERVDFSWESVAGKYLGAEGVG